MNLILLLVIIDFNYTKKLSRNWMDMVLGWGTFIMNKDYKVFLRENTMRIEKNNYTSVKYFGNVGVLDIKKQNIL